MEAGKASSRPSNTLRRRCTLFRLCKVENCMLCLLAYGCACAHHNLSTTAESPKVAPSDGFLDPTRLLPVQLNVLYAGLPIPHMTAQTQSAGGPYQQYGQPPYGYQQIAPAYPQQGPQPPYQGVKPPERWANPLLQFRESCTSPGRHGCAHHTLIPASALLIHSHKLQRSHGRPSSAIWQQLFLI